MGFEMWETSKHDRITRQQHPCHGVILIEIDRKTAADKPTSPKLSSVHALLVRVRAIQVPVAKVFGCPAQEQQ